MMSGHRCVRLFGGAVLLTLFVGVLGAAVAQAQQAEVLPPETVAPAAESPQGETRWSLWLGNELSSYAGAQSAQPSASNLALAQPSLAYRHGDRWHAGARLVGLVDTYGSTRTRLRVREAYAAVSVGDWDLLGGKRLVRWGTGLAFTVVGVLDPPRRPDDVADRLDLNEGRELAQVSWVHGRHALTLAWATAGILERRSADDVPQTLAFRHNMLIAGIDLSLILAREQGGVDMVGGSFSSVVASHVELHGELAHRSGLARMTIPGIDGSVALDDTSRWGFVLGAKGMLGWGVDLLAEARSTDGLLPTASPPSITVADSQVRLGTERRATLFVGLNKARLRELPGWKEWDLGASIVASLSDGSALVILDVERRLGLRWTLHGRLLLPRGGRPDSEYGMIPYTSQASIGLRCQL